MSFWLEDIFWAERKFGEEILIRDHVQKPYRLTVDSV